MTLPDFTPSQRERLGRAAHASCPRHAPWEALFPAARAAFEEQGVAVAREMLAMLAESDAPTPPPPTLAERVAAATERRFFLDAGMRPR